MISSVNTIDVKNFKGEKFRTEDLCVKTFVVYVILLKICNEIPNVS